ncbi:hypothetical protein RI367_008053 [Sorochytrium milnesiophthora]
MVANIFTTNDHQTAFFVLAALALVEIIINIIILTGVSWHSVGVIFAIFNVLQIVICFSIAFGFKTKNLKLYRSALSAYLCGLIISIVLGVFTFAAINIGHIIGVIFSIVFLAFGGNYYRNFKDQMA